MDRNKGGGSNRGQKKGPSHLSSEFYALGTKGTRDDAKSKIIPVKSTSSDRKREAPSTLASSSKKPKLSLLKVSGDATTSASQYELWEQLATDCEPINLIEATYAAIEQNDNEAILRLICGTIKHLIATNSRNKIDTVSFLALTYLAKLHPSFFCNDILIGALISILRRDANTKSRYSANLHILATNLLTRGFSERSQWPECFLRTYIDDAINERFWSDNEFCAPFINNICAAFKTRTPSSHLLRPETVTSASVVSAGQSIRDVNINVDDDSGDNSTHGVDSGLSANTSEQDNIPSDTYYSVQNRFGESEHIVEKYVIEAIRDQLNKRQQQDNYTRNFLKFLCTSSGIAEVRYLCIARLELWIHNGKLVKFAQQLLSYICFNIKGKCFKDHEVLAVLVKMRLKTKPLINHYMSCLKEVINLQPDILSIILKLVVQNELSNTRNPNNMGMLATMFQASPDQSASNLAEIYQEFLLQRDDCLRTLRVFLRELVRMLRYDVNIVKFCKVFLTERADLSNQIELSEFRERIFISMVDIVCLCMLLSVTPQAREAIVAARTSRDTKSNQVLIKYYNHMSQIQLDAISWMYEIVPNLFKASTQDYNQALHKLLLLENPEQYSRADQWPSEPERGTLIRMISETPVHEETLLRIILIGITKDIPFTITDTFDVILLVIRRVSAMKITNCPAVQANKFDIIDFLFSMSEYHHPENIKLPADYDPPKLAIIVLYWKAWLILLMISAHNPSTFGAFCWDHYPTMKMLMEMCITNQIVNGIASKDELQILPVERDHILQFETYLAAQTSQTVITEDNAILISQLMLMDPMGAARKVPNNVLDQLKYLNRAYKLGHLFCRSRKPDLLLDIIQRQGTTQSMPWLSDLVQNSDGEFNHLPVQCLCEFLLYNAHNINEENSRDAELVNFLRNLLTDPNFNKQTVCEVLDYIFRRLSSTVKQSRVAALAGAKIIFKSTGPYENEWLLKAIPQIPHFMDVRAFIIPQLRAACQVENCPELVMSYIQFIAGHTLNDPVNEMLDHVIDMAQLIVERSTMFQHIIVTPEEYMQGAHENRIQTLNCLFVMFNNYIIKLREYHEPYEWTEYPDLLMVQFNDGVQLPLHINIIHAFIILLTHSSENMPESIPILDYWFPPGRPAPVAYLPNMLQEPVQLLPDWLKLKMIRSSVDRLIEAALHDLTPDQIVLFVQNFGTPVNSMSKLLALLDRAVIEQFDSVKNAILNKAYLAQLIEIQQARGAKNGHFTVQALELHSHAQTVPDLPKLEVEMLVPINLTDFDGVAPISALCSTKSIKDVDEVMQTILKCPELDVHNNSRFRRLIHHLLKSNNENLVQNVGLANKALTYLLKTIECSNGAAFYQNIAQNQHTCTFFRVLLHNFDDSAENLQILLTIIDEALNQTNEYLTTTPTMALKGRTHCTSIVTMLQHSKNALHHNKSASSTDCLLKKEIIQKVLISLSDNQSLQTFKTEVTSNDDGICYNGLFVDWLAEVDPEIIMTTKNLNMNVLFSKRCSEFQFYLLSLINHQTNWATIVSLIDYLLRNIKPDYDYSTVLNYFEALMNNPKLWQGRDKCVSKSNKPDSVFLLKEPELKAFTQFILQEGACEIESNGDIANYDYKLCSRIDLLLRVTKKQSKFIVKFADYVSNNGCAESLKLQVLQQMYLMHPSIKFIKLNKAGEQAYKLQVLKGCEADRVTNYLITCLGSLSGKKDFETLCSDTELLIRKLAASHPSLFLRQLGVLSSLIQGRAQNDIRALREEFHFHRFVQILRTLELLQPMIFDDTYKNEFQTTLNCYFTFFKHHSSVKEAYQILMKFVQLLQSYINVNPTSALMFIEQYVGILTELAARFTTIAPLHQLVQAIALLQHKTLSSHELDDDEIKQEFDLDDATSDIKTPSKVTATVAPSTVVAIAPSTSAAASDAESFESTTNATPQLDMNSRGALSFVISGTYNKSGAGTVSPQFLNLIKIIKHSNAEDVILGPLQEIECLTSKRFSFLNELFDRLLDLIFSPSAQIRSNAFIILIRHLKHNPGLTDINRCTLNAYIQCLRDDNSSVAATAVDNLAEMTLLMQEHAVEILAAAFALGIKSRLNTSTQIKRVLQTLTLQHGY